MTWIVLGPVALLLTVWGLVSRSGGWFTGLDALFVIVVGGMMLGRWVQQRSGFATTLQGELATVEQCKRYAAILLLGAAATSIVANVVGDHVLA